MNTENEKTIESWRNFIDLNLSLSVELGQIRLKIREILKLAPDSIIKLSRSTGEGVDIRADDRPLLRGEIVVVEDRAGIRISEILTGGN